MFENIMLRLELTETLDRLIKERIKNIELTDILIAAMQSDNPKEVITRKWKEMRDGNQRND